DTNPPNKNSAFACTTQKHSHFQTGPAGPHSGEAVMLSWDEFDKPEEGTTAKPAAAQQQPTEMSLERLDSVGDAAAHEARAVDANDSAAVARAKAALNELDIQEGLNELEGESARVRVDEKRMINARADLNQLVPFKYDWAWQ